MPLSQPLPVSQSCSSRCSTQDGVREKWVSLPVIHTAREAGCSLTCSHFPLWKKSWAKKVSLGPELCHLGEGVLQVKVNCSFYYASKFIYIFLLQWCPRTSLLETWASTKPILSVVDYLRHCSPGATGLQLKWAGDIWAICRTHSQD